MTDLDAIKARVQVLQRHAGGTDYAAQVIADNLALVAEVEWLRERDDNFCDDFHRETSEAYTPDELHCSCVPHLRAEVERLRIEVADERAAVVAWLRLLSSFYPSSYGDICANMTDSIKRGEHRREG